MTQPHRTFTRQDLDAILSAQEFADEFQQFVVRRFADYTRYTEVVGLGGTRIRPVTDPFRTDDGRGRWRVVSHGWLDHVGAQAEGAAEAYIEVELVVFTPDGDTLTGESVAVPLAFIFGETEQDAKYAEFLRLKAQFEPETLPVSSETTRAAARAAVPARLAAQRLLSVLPPDQRVSVGMMLADERVAAGVYRTALTLAEQMGEDAGDLSLTSRMRADIHAHAAVLGLGLDALDPAEAQEGDGPASEKASRERLEAARYLWVQSRPRRVTTSRSLWDWARTQAEDAARTGEHLADPANREEAAAAYRHALDLLLSPTAVWLKDVRRRVHDAATVLGLTDEDLKTPGSGASESGPAGPAGAATGQPTEEPVGDSVGDPDEVTTNLGYTLFNDLTERLLGSARREAHTRDVAQRHYEKARAMLTLAGSEVFGKHTDEVLTVLDDVTDLIGLTSPKKKR